MNTEEYLKKFRELIDAYGWSGDLAEDGKDKMIEDFMASSLKEVREHTLNKIESIYLEFEDDPKQALTCIAEYIDISLNAKGSHSIDANGNCNHGCC